MKWCEIPEFTSVGNYEINSPLDFLEDSILRYEQDYGLQLNPDFQRGHVWNTHQQERYVEYFLKCGQSGRVIYFNKPSWQGNATSSYDDFVCVDGLQRITALRLFIKNEIKAFGQYKGEFGDSIRPSRAVDNLRLNINNLKTKQEVLEWYIQLNSGGVVHTEEEISRVRLMLDNEVK